jgi:hypothetical protein
LKFLKHGHGIESQLAKLPDRRAVRLATEEAMVVGKCRFDLGVSRQNGNVRCPQPFSSLALCEKEIVYALLCHQPGGFLSQRAAQVVGAGVASLAHLRCLQPAWRYPGLP